ncbi:MAG TPA: PAS domain S-box protein [Gemmataceae bacterium]|nr:PAS domain S-box protein [Gemmataceae bacterium]
MHETPRGRLVAYGIAVLATAGCLFIRWPLWPVLEDAVPHMTFFPAVMIAAYFGGFWPGLLATILSAVAANYFIPRHIVSFQARSVNDLAALILFVLVGTIISGLCESLHRARRRIVVDERQRAEHALRETEERFRQLAENIHEIFWMLDSAGDRMIYISPGYEEISGRTRRSLYEQPRSWVENIHPDDRDWMIETVEQYGRGVFPQVEFRLVRPDGSFRWMRSRAFAINDPVGHVSCFAGLAEDITERKHAEEALAQERDLLHTLMDNLPDNMFFKDAASRFVRVNKALTTYFGLNNPAQAMGKTDFDFFTEEHARQAYEDEQEIIRTGQPVVGKEEKETWLDGRVRWVSATKMPFRDNDGKIIGTFGVARDITRVKLAEEGLRESEQRFRTFVDHATDAFFLQDDRGVILDVNCQACASLGYTREELVGKTPFDFDPDMTSATIEELSRKLDAGETVAFESRHRRKDGVIFPVEIRGRAFWEGGRRFLVSLARDINERKRDEALLDGQKRILERIIQGEALPEVLTFLCRTIEELAQGDILASVLLLDADGVHLRHGAAPGLPEAYVQAIDGLAIGPSVGSCGTAAYRREPVFVSDIASDPLWAPFAHLALPHGLRACWSSPILSSAAEVLGTFAMYYRQPRRPTPHDLRVVDIVARTVAIAIERSRAEQALRESEHRWRSLTEALPQLVWTAAPDGACDYFSTQWTQHTGVPETRLLGWQWLEVLHPDDREPTRKLWTDSVAERGPYDVEYRVRRSDGVYRWFKTRGVPIRDSAGKIVKWFGTCTDITTSKQLEEELLQANARLDLAVRGSNIAIWENDLPDGVLENSQSHFVNVWEQLGYDGGRSPSDFAATMGLVHPDDRDRMRRAVQANLSGETGEYKAEYRVRHRDGSYRWVLSRGVTVRDATGKPIRMAGSRIDITEMKRAEKELRQAKDTAEAANRAKDEFLANVSHEIRTPMNAILGMTELALDTPLTEDQRQCLRTVKSAADNLLGIINDLLDFSKIEAGKLELDLGDFSLRAAVVDTVRALAVRAHTKGLELVCQVQPDVPDALIGDAGRLRQVLLNLVGNALKFTEQGEVVVSVEVERVRGRGPGVSEYKAVTEKGRGASGSEEDVPSSLTPNPSPLTPVQLRFAVRDTGIGIPPDKQEKIFRAFEQEDTSTTRRYGGTGLGLTIAARLVSLMGGTIHVESQDGRGSTFTFTARFGLQPHPPEPVAARPPIPLRNLRVLVVDDNDTNRRILEEWLRDWQMDPVAVGDGLAALNALWHGTVSGRPYALTLLDARMPDTDGLTLASLIREKAELAGTRIVLLTSGERPRDLARARELRLNAHLLKPVQQDDLLETIYDVMSQTTERMKDEGGGMKADPSLIPHPSSLPLRILIAEDNEFNSQLLEQLLVRRGHRVQVVNNGREALALLGMTGQKSEISDQKSEIGGQKLEINEDQALSSLTSDLRPLTSDFDLLLLDVHMPELDGFQVIQAIRDRERSAGGHLPVIALTARSRQEDRERCLAAGMDDFLSKPIHAADLWAAIDRVAGGRKPADAGGRLLLDARVLLAACGGDTVILDNICRAFRARLPDQLTAVREALRDEDRPRLREAAHKLCGMVAAFSSVAGAAASQLEDYAAQDQLEEAQPLVGQLETMGQDLMRLVGEVSLDALRDQARAATEANQTARL